ncbi:MAG: xanthine dehydrogenase family protein subunit M [candidate division KSB1 bacterium]|nr:xanthine dehydrogenase family protein subunit M [candidate division KSB1 bacterium]MDZ7317551.1 xanthine dehydrogenase family protein subunit M [candidate division KSB1 bacterium]
MKNFQYIYPKTLKEASQLLGKNWQTALLFAGGTDLLGLMKDHIEAPDKLINLKSVPDLNQIVYQPGTGLSIGALVTVADIAEHPIIRKKYAVLAEAAQEVASPQLRNVGTIGGNLCQRPRCWYFRGEFHCLRKGGDLCYAVDGRNKFHCVIGGGPCFIVHPSDTAVALTALAAQVVIFSGKKSRSLPIRDFFILPEQNVMRENVLQPGEIVTHILIPELPPNTRSGYLKVKERGAWDFALVSAAAVIQLPDSSVQSGTLALGGVAPKPWLEKNVSAQLNGLTITAENIATLSRQALAAAEPLEQNSYKVPLAQNIIKKLLFRITA